MRMKKKLLGGLATGLLLICGMLAEAEKLEERAARTKAIKR